MLDGKVVGVGANTPKLRSLLTTNFHSVSNTLHLDFFCWVALVEVVW